MKFSYSKIESYCNEMNNISDNIKNILEDINNNLTKLENCECWQGKGYEYYYNKLKKITNNFEEVNDSIKNNIRYLEETAENYNGLDKQIVSFVSDFLQGE